jgi:uncharacterized protein YbcV (DUF1398 family)
MDNNIINECVSLSSKGKITFPEVIMKLIEAGVERYTADLVALNLHYYGTNGKVYTTPLEFDGSAVSPAFDGVAVKAAITDSQQGRIDYQTFLKHVIAAGCSHYEVFITGKKVIYLGRDGGQHIELFPQGK